MYTRARVIELTEMGPQGCWSGQRRASSFARDGHLNMMDRLPETGKSMEFLRDLMRLHLGVLRKKQMNLRPL